MIDYKLLGALLGSVWKNHHPDEGYNTSDQVRACKVCSEVLGFDMTADETYTFAQSFLRTASGRCYVCGEAVSSFIVQRRDGVYICQGCLRHQEKEGNA